MNIGILKEVKEDERRVALQPRHATMLASHGHCVFVESGAGDGAGFTDAEYCANGAAITTKQEVLARCQLILKVKAPILAEYQDYTPRHTLFTYLHFDENIPARDLMQLIDTGFTGLAYEWVGADGDYPLLQPMSRLTGYLFAHKALELCAREKGVFCPSNEQFLPGGRSLVIGTGNIGLSAFKYLSDLGVQLTIVANTDRLETNRRANRRFGTEDIDYIGRAGADFITMDRDNPERTRDTIAGMLPGAIYAYACERT